MRTVCVLGIGTIGRHLIGAIRAGTAGAYQLAAIADRPAVENELRALAVTLGVPYTTEPIRLLEHKPFVLVEAASQDALLAYGVRALEAGAHLMAMSIGALTDPDFASELLGAARRAERRVVIPSGAIGGLDALLAARQGALREVSLVTTKPPRALAGAPFFIDHPIDLDRIEAATTLFEGSVADATRLFPANLNVASALSLAIGAGAAVRVRIVADPSATQNVHEVSARGDFGEISLRFANQPSSNPRTSLLAVYAAVAALRQLDEPLQFG